MESIHNKILKKNYHINSSKFRDYKSPQDVVFEQLEFKKVRGSVRLQDKKVLTPNEFSKIKDSAINIKFP